MLKRALGAWQEFRLSAERKDELQEIPSCGLPYPAAQLSASSEASFCSSFAAQSSLLEV